MNAKVILPLIASYKKIYTYVMEKDTSAIELTYVGGNLPIINFAPSALFCCRMFGPRRVSLLIRAFSSDIYPQFTC